MYCSLYADLKKDYQRVLSLLQGEKREFKEEDSLQRWKSWHFDKAAPIPFEEWEKLVGIKVRSKEQYEYEIWNMPSKCHQAPPPLQIISKNGLILLRHIDLGEWLDTKNQAVSTMFLGGASYPASAAEADFASGDKNMFRLCFEE